MTPEWLQLDITTTPLSEDIEVVQRGQTAEAGVVEDRPSGPATLDDQQERVAVLGEQLLPLRVER